MKRIELKALKAVSPGSHLQILLQKFMLTSGLFFKNELLNHAAAAAFFFILSVIPVFFLIIFSFDRYLTSFPEVSEVFFSFLKELNHNLDKDLFVRVGLLNVKATAIGVFGLINLIWAGCWILSSIQMGLAVVFPAKKRKHLAMNVFSVAILIFLLFISFLATLVSVGLNLFNKFLESEIIILVFMQYLLPYANRILPVAVVFLIIFMAYRYVPAQQPDSRSSLVGALWCSLAIILMHNLFSRFADVTRFNVIYGVLGSLIFTFLLMQLTFVLFFFFAEYTYVSEKIDILLLEKMFFYKFNRDVKGRRVEKLLFKSPRYIFEKYARTYRAGEVLFKEGDRVEEIYYVERGRIGIFRRHGDSETRIADIQQGEVFGEMAYLLEENRTATAIADTDAVLLIITPELFEELISRKGFSRDVIRSLSERIRKTNLFLQTGEK